MICSQKIVVIPNRELLFRLTSGQPVATQTYSFAKLRGTMP